MNDDSAYAEPLPPTWALDAAARNAGFKEWFEVPSFFRTPTNRFIIVEARRIVKRYGVDQLVAECRERASYLEAMRGEGLSTLELQCMETLFKAADRIEALLRDSGSGPTGLRPERAQGEAPQSGGEAASPTDLPNGAIQ